MHITILTKVGVKISELQLKISEREKENDK